jgi:hypothetical protein
MRFLSFGAVICIGIVMIGCEAKQTQETADQESKPLMQADIVGIKAKVAELAATEIERFNAIESEYKDEVKFWPATGHPLHPESGVYCRVYRVFDAHELLNIELTSNLIKPVLVTVEYSAKVYSTPIYHSDYDDSEEKATQDTNFEFNRDEKVAVSYELDQEGNLAGSLPDPPQRASYWNEASLTPLKLE